MKHPTAVITGGTDGIGRAVALNLARQGFSVQVVGRNPARAKALVQQLRAEFGSGDHGYFLADLGLVHDTARLADHLTTRVSQLDALVCCAGQFAYRPTWTGEGMERAFVLNYLSRYLLVRRLLPHLEAASSGRVVLVANAGRYRDTLDFDDLQYRHGKHGLTVAARSQVANDLFAVELAACTCDTTVEVTCVDPGVVKTELFRHAEGLPPWAQFALPRIAGVIGRPVAEAADTPSWLAADPAAVRISGQFFGPRRKPRRVPDRARRADRRRQLWEASEALVADYLEPGTEAVDPAVSEAVP